MGDGNLYRWIDSSAPLIRMKREASLHLPAQFAARIRSRHPRHYADSPHSAPDTAPNTKYEFPMRVQRLFPAYIWVNTTPCVPVITSPPPAWVRARTNKLDGKTRQAAIDRLFLYLLVASFYVVYIHHFVFTFLNKLLYLYRRPISSAGKLK